MSTEELIYDPLRVFVKVFSDSMTANDVGETLSCQEVNALVALLDACGETTAASWYLDTHRNDPDDGCAEPGIH